MAFTLGRARASKNVPFSALLPIASTGFINWIAVALIIPIAMIVTPYGVGIAHALSKRKLEVGFGLFCLFVAVRFFLSLL